MDLISTNTDTSSRTKQIVYQFEKEILLETLSNTLAAQGDHDLNFIQLSLDNDKLSLTSINHTLSIQSECPIPTSVPCTIKLSARQLYDYIKYLPTETINITFYPPEQMLIQCAQSSAKFQLVQDSMDMSIIVPHVGSEIQILASALEGFVDRFRDFVAVDDARFFANGAFFTLDKFEEEYHLMAVSCDNSRLAQVRLSSQDFTVSKADSGHVLIPRKTLDEIKRICSKYPKEMIHLKWDQSNHFLSCQLKNYTLVSKCISGEYPPYSSAFPQKINKSIVLQKKEILQSIRRILLFSDKTNVINLVFDQNQVKIESSIPGQKEAFDYVPLAVPCEDPFIVKYNGHLMTTILNMIPTQDVVFSWESPTRPVMITSTEESSFDSKYLVVPIHI
jgi:DNA polymerase-3 subunit beta